MVQFCSSISPLHSIRWTFQYIAHKIESIMYANTLNEFPDIRRSGLQIGLILLETNNIISEQSLLFI